MEIEWLILADAAQVVDGKLYLLGGGWDRLTINTGFPVQNTIAVAMSFTVPWLETNQQHHIQLEITDQDHTKVLATLEAGLEVGRPPGIEHGTEQRSQLAAAFPLTIERPGVYEINVQIKDSDSPGKRAILTVVPGPLLAMRMSSGTP